MRSYTERVVKHTEKMFFPQIDTSNEDGLYTPLTMTRVCNRKRIGFYFGNARQRRKQEETRSKKHTV